MKKCIRSNTPPASQRIGLITLIPKGDKDQKFISNWTPICFLNCLYKLLSSILANRSSKALEDVISPYQTGYLKDRSISENTLTMATIIEDALSTNNRGIMIAIDFQKAFDFYLKITQMVQILRKFHQTYHYDTDRLQCTEQRGQYDNERDD